MSSNDDGENTGGPPGGDGATPLPLGVAVRDTEDRGRAPHLYSATAWRAFVAAVRAGEFDR